MNGNRADKQKPLEAVTVTLTTEKVEFKSQSITFDEEGLFNAKYHTQIKSNSCEH